MSDDLRTDHVKLGSPSVFTKKFSFFCPAIGPFAHPPCLLQCIYTIHMQREKRICYDVIGNRNVLTAELSGDSVITSAAKYCDDRVCLSVCVCVCLSVRYHIFFGTTRPIFTEFFVPVTYGRGSVLLWRRRCDMLCASGFTDDVVSAHNGPYARVPVHT